MGGILTPPLTQSHHHSLRQQQGDRSVITASAVWKVMMPAISPVSPPIRIEQQP
jgi:hypothetical protein